MELSLFLLLASGALATAVLVVIQRNPVYSALFLVVTLFCLGGLYLLLQAEFIAAVHIIVYAGAIMVLFLFVLMLLDLRRDPVAWLPRDRTQIILGVLLTVLLVLELLPVLRVTVPATLLGPHTPERIRAVGNTQMIGRLLFTDYLLPFEVTSVILLIAIIGAVILAGRRQP